MKLGFAKRHLRAPFVANSGSSPRAFDSSSSPPSQSPSPCHIRCVEYDRTRWTLGHTRHHSVVIPHRNARATSGQGRYRACDAVQREVSGCSGRDLARKRSRSGGRLATGSTHGRTPKKLKFPEKSWPKYQRSLNILAICAPRHSKLRFRPFDAPRPSDALGNPPYLSIWTRVGTSKSTATRCDDVAHGRDRTRQRRRVPGTNRQQ